MGIPGLKEMCKGCADRGRNIRAAKMVAGEPMCSTCILGDDASYSSKVIKDEQIPRYTLGSQVSRDVETLKAAPKDTALKVRFKGYPKFKVQHAFHEYAKRFGINIETYSLDGFLYVRKVAEKRRMNGRVGQSVREAR